MSTKKFDYLVFIGRFQPFHIGHKEVIEQALSISDKVIVLIGSAFQPRTPKNPWTAMERMGMIFEGLDNPKDRVIAVPLQDQMYNDQKWVADVQEKVHSVAPSGKIGIIGHTKDQSSYYLKMFPQWELVEHPMNEHVNATDIRGIYFDELNTKYIQAVLPPPVYDLIQKFRKTEDYNTLVRWHKMVKQYKKAWEVAPYPPTFVTTDAVVVQSGHILLVERGAAPGEGLLALPGGFLNQNERLVDGVVRELREETKLKVPAPVLKGNIKNTHVFDHPDRSSRGRTITHAFLIELPPGELPPVKGSDDAREAMWVPISEINSELLFEDHYFIIQYFLGTI